MVILLVTPRSLLRCWFIPAIRRYTFARVCLAKHVLLQLEKAIDLTLILWVGLWGNVVVAGAFPLPLPLLHLCFFALQPG
jgi:hypothetical protein